MRKEKTVKTYRRRTKTGKVVIVRQHKAKYNAAEEVAKETPKKKGAGEELAAHSKNPIEDLGFTAAEYKEWYQWDMVEDPDNETCLKVEKILKKRMGKKAYDKYMDEVSDNYTPRGHIKAFKGLGDKLDETKQPTEVKSAKTKVESNKKSETLAQRVERLEKYNGKVESLKNPLDKKIFMAMSGDEETERRLMKDPELKEFFKYQAERFGLSEDFLKKVGFNPKKEKKPQGALDDIDRKRTHTPTKRERDVAVEVDSPAGKVEVRILGNTYIKDSTAGKFEYALAYNLSDDKIKPIYRRLDKGEKLWMEAYNDGGTFDVMRINGFKPNQLKHKFHGENHIEGESSSDAFKGTLPHKVDKDMRLPLGSREFTSKSETIEEPNGDYKKRIKKYFRSKYQGKIVSVDAIITDTRKDSNGNNIKGTTCLITYIDPSSKKTKFRNLFYSSDGEIREFQLYNTGSVGEYSVVKAEPMRLQDAHSSRIPQRKTDKPKPSASKTPKIPMASEKIIAKHLSSKYDTFGSCWMSGSKCYVDFKDDGVLEVSRGSYEKLLQKKRRIAKGQEDRGYTPRKAPKRK